MKIIEIMSIVQGRDLILNEDVQHKIATQDGRKNMQQKVGLMQGNSLDQDRHQEAFVGP